MNITTVILFFDFIFCYEEHCEIDSDEEYIVPKILWMYWEGFLPNMTKYCLHHLKANLLYYKILYLNSNTVRCYINSTDIPLSLTKIPHANQADYYRFHLLSLYGGVWLDASAYVKDDSVFDELINEMYQIRADMLAFNFVYYPQNNIEIGIIFCPKNSEFLNRVIKIHDYGMKTDRLEVMKGIINSGVEINVTYQYRYNKETGKESYNTFFFAYYCVQYVLQKEYNGVANIITKRAEDWFYKFNIDYNWYYPELEKQMNENNALENYKLVIFNKGNRKYMKVNFDGII